MRVQTALVFGFGIFLLTPALSYAAPLKSTLEVSGWIPFWREDVGTADVIPHLDSLTAVHPFGYTVTSDGILNDAMGISDDPWKTLITLAKAKKVRVIPTVMWGDPDSIHRILTNSTTRIALEDEIAALVKREGFDGIDIDFEAKYSKTRPYFSLFLKGLYQRMGKAWVYCTIEARTPLSSRYPDGNAPADATDYANDYVALNKYCDRVQIMAYDQGRVDKKLDKTAADPYAPVSDVLWAKKVMQLAAQTISKRKLVLGIPTYGYEWSVTPLIDSTLGYSRLWAFNPRYALDLASAQGLVPSRNMAGELSFTYIPQVVSSTPNTLGVPTSAQVVGPAASQMQTFNFLSWSDAIAIAQKIAVAKELGIRGVAVFKFDGGEDPGMWDVLK